MPLSGTGIGGHAAVSATNTLTFPDWYQDEGGVRLDQCLDPNNPECLVLPGGTFDGTNTNLSFPDNFPDEFFWYDADADVLSTPGCNGTAPGKLRFRFALEGAFLNGDPAVGDQMTFGRLRVQGSGGLCPTHDYTVVTPYGTWKVTTDDLGGLKPGRTPPTSAARPAPRRAVRLLAGPAQRRPRRLPALGPQPAARRRRPATSVTRTSCTRWSARRTAATAIR